MRGGRSCPSASPMPSPGLTGSSWSHLRELPGHQLVNTDPMLWAPMPAPPTGSCPSPVATDGRLGRPRAAGGNRRQLGQQTWAGRCQGTGWRWKVTLVLGPLGSCQFLQLLSLQKKVWGYSTSLHHPGVIPFRVSPAWQKLVASPQRGTVPSGTGLRLDTPKLAGHRKGDGWGRSQGRLVPLIHGRIGSCLSPKSSAMLGSTSFQAAYSLTGSRLVSCDSVPSGLPLRPSLPSACWPGLGLGSWTPGSHLTSSLRPMEPMPTSECSLQPGGQTSTQKAPCLLSSHPQLRSPRARVPEAVPPARTPEDLE